MQFIKLAAPAKINWFLQITGQRADGYHTLQTVFQFLEFGDELSFRINATGSLSLTPHLIGVPPTQNLVLKAARLLREYTGCHLGVDVTLQKRIPLGAGLAGGSTNAATTLVALNRLWQLDLPLTELLALAVQLGADVPIFVYGKSAFAEGIGEVLTPLLLPQPWYVLVLPPCHVSTEKLFKDPRLVRNTPPISIEQFETNFSYNAFEALVRADYPEVEQAFAFLSQHAMPKMTGSGGCVFATFDSEEKASRIASLVPAPLKALVTRGSNQSPLYKSLD